MSQLHTVAIHELGAQVVSTLGFNASKVVTRATKMARYDWRDLIQREESTGDGLETPFVVIRQKETEVAEWGLNNKAFNVPVDIILVDKNENRIETTVTAGATSATQALASVTGIFVGQYLFFDTANVWRRVVSIAALNVTLDSSLTTTTGERVFSETVTDVECRLELLRDVFAPTKFTNFQTVDDSRIDVTDYNYVNQIFLGTNYPLFAGILSLNLLVGETYD